MKPSKKYILLLLGLTQQPSYLPAGEAGGTSSKCPQHMSKGQDSLQQDYIGVICDSYQGLLRYGILTVARMKSALPGARNGRCQLGAATRLGYRRSQVLLACIFVDVRSAQAHEQYTYTYTCTYIYIHHVDTNTGVYTYTYIETCVCACLNDTHIYIYV